MGNTKALEVANGHPAIIEAKELGYTYDEPYPTITDMCRDIRNLRAKLAEAQAQVAAERAIADYMADAWARVEAESHCGPCKENYQTSEEIYSRWCKHLAARQKMLIEV